MKRVFVECALVEQTTVIGPSVVGPPLLGRALLDRATRPVAPTFSFGWTFGVRHILYGVVEQILLDQPLLDHPLLDRATKPVAPTFVGVDIIELRFDKMSNEGVYNVLPHTKIRFGGFGGPSRAIRKIQIDADRGVGTTFRRVLGTDGCPFFCFSFLISLFLLPSDLLTAPFF